MQIKPLEKEQFDLVYENLGVAPNLSKDYIYEAYLYAMSGAQALLDSNILGRAVPINSVVLLLYFINEYGFYLDTHQITADAIKDDEEVMSQLVSVALDKYFTNEHLNFKNQSSFSKFSPIISTLDIYLNFILGVLKKYPKNNPQETLVLDMTYKGFSMMKAISDLIVDGFETEAFSLWRTLHETECILTLLSKHGEKAIKAYLKHIQYALAYRGAIPSKEETDKVFVNIKSEMAQLSLKSKDMKKFIEYGWLTSIEGYNADPDFKFNFRDGVERLAGLHNYSHTYEMASEIAHSSPLLIYSRASYYLHLSILLLYESFFRLEALFKEQYLSRISEEETKRYMAMRGLYHIGLQVLYKREQEVFKKLNEAKKNAAE